MSRIVDPALFIFMSAALREFFLRSNLAEEAK